MQTNKQRMQFLMNHFPSLCIHVMKKNGMNKAKGMHIQRVNNRSKMNNIKGMGKMQRMA